MKRLTILEIDQCRSTNDEAWKSTEAPTLVVAHRQTAGRGRQGRSWQAGPYGNIAMSLFVAPPAEGTNWVPLAAGVAAIEALEQAAELCQAAPDALAPLRLKWPNDIFASNRKIGGILCESRVSGERVSGLVIGIGINMISAPELADVVTASFFGDVVQNVGDTQPTLIVAARWLVIREWANRLGAWIEQIGLGQTDLLRRAWIRCAKLDDYPNLVVHDRNHAIVEITAGGLDSRGRLEARLKTDPSRTVYLDQADSL